MPACTPPRASSSGLPISRVVISARSSARSARASATRARCAPLSAGAVRAHAEVAFRASWTASSTAAGPATSTSPTGEPVAGSTIVILCWLCTDLPPHVAPGNGSRDRRSRYPGQLGTMPPSGRLPRTGDGYRSPMSRRAVVTGGAGFLGSWVADELAERGFEVVCVDNLLTGRRSNLDGSPHTLVLADVSEHSPVDGGADLVLHLASPASPPAYLAKPLETLRVGSAGTENALELARTHGARFVLASTSEVYGDPAVHPQPESYWGNVNPIGPRSVYDEAKRYAEALTMAYHRHQGVDTCIVRIFNTYGKRMRPNDGRAIPTFRRQAQANEPLTVFGDGSQTRSFCYVDDLIRGLVLLAESGEHLPVNIGNPQELTLLELAENVVRVTGAKSEIVFEALPVDDPQVRQPDITRARQLLGWEPQVGLEEGLRRVLEATQRESLSV